MERTIIDKWGLRGHTQVLQSSSWEPPMKPLLIALFGLCVASSSARAQDRAGQVFVPQGVLSKQERAKIAAETLKTFTDTLRVPGGEPFPAPIPIVLFNPKQVGARDFFSTTPFMNFKDALSTYRLNFFWDENNPVSSPHMDSERFMIAYAIASKRGGDPLAGGKWVCSFRDALRGYFKFYEATAADGSRDEEGGELSRNIWGGGTGAAQSQQLLNGQLARRYQEASGIDLKDALNYDTVQECLQAVEAAIPNTKDVPPLLIPSVMNTKTLKQPILIRDDGGDDGGDLDVTRYNYWVYYADQSWQTWGYVAGHAKARKWTPDAKGLMNFLRCRARDYPGTICVQAEKNARPGKSAYYPPEGAVPVRHPFQPENVKAKFTKENQKLLAEDRKTYCR